MSQKGAIEEEDKQKTIEKKRKKQIRMKREGTE